MYDPENDDCPELKLSGEKAFMCTGEYRRRMEKLEDIGGLSREEADSILQKRGVSRFVRHGEIYGNGL